MGKKSTKTTSTSQPWAPAQPILTGAGNDILNTVNANQGNLNSQEAMLNGQLPSMYQNATNSSTLAPGMGYLNDTLGGKYLNTNPYTTAMTQQAGNDAANHVNSTFSMAGRTGSNNHAFDLSRGVDQAENAILFQNYQNERGLQNSAASQLPSYQSAQSSAMQNYLQATQLAGQLPYYGANSLGNIGGLFSGYGTQTAKQPGGWGTDLLNAGIAAAPGLITALSDRRLKKDITKIGEAKDGLGIYTFRYKSDPDAAVYRGVMADEVKLLRPQAYIENYRDGYAGVNYAALGAM